MQQLQPNTLLQGGKYRIERVLGQGSFGVTYLAEHTSLGRKVCVKEFFMKELNTRKEDGSITAMSQGTLSYNYAQKFRKEAMNMARMEHPNIVRVTDSFEENGTYYYVMDYIDGQNLNDYVKNKTVSESEAISIIKDVADALIYMHEEKHMLHLDLKPGNIMRRNSDGHIFLIDFGLSKHYSNDGQPETSTTIGLGTAGYAPIEQGNKAKDGEFRPTIDVYALGATLYKLLTRETPPAASELVSDDELLVDKLKEKSVSQDLIDFIVKSMLPNVRKRIQSIRSFKEMLPFGGTTSSITSNHAVENDEETVYVDSNDEETELASGSVSLPKHPNFEESTYVIEAKHKNYPTSTATKAQEGDTDAAIAYGMMCLRGEGLQQDFDTAYSWFVLAKDKGDDRGEKLIEQWSALKEKYSSQKDKSSSQSNGTNGFVEFFTKYATAIMIIAGIVFVYDIVCYSLEYAWHAENLNTYFGYGVLHNLVELSMFYVLGVKFLSCNKWYLGFATLCIALWIGQWSIDWNANYVWIIMGGTLTDSMAEFSQFVSDCAQYGGLLLMIAFLIGVILAKNAIGKTIFVLLMIYAGTQFIPHYLNPEGINQQVLSITEYVVLLIAIALYFFSEKQKKAMLD